VNSKEAFGVTIFQPAVATQKKKETNFHTLRRRLTEYTTYYEISEEGKKKKRIKKRSECFSVCPKTASSSQFLQFCAARN